MHRGVLTGAARLGVTGTLALSLAIPPSFAAEAHVVNLTELQQQVQSASQLRQNNLAKAQAFLSSRIAQQAMQRMKVDSTQMPHIVSRLSDAELQRLAARADQADADLVAGRLTERDLLFIIVGLVALILIIVAVR